MIPSHASHRHPLKSTLAVLGIALGLLSIGATGFAPGSEGYRKALTDERLAKLETAFYRYYEDALEWPDDFRSLVARPAGVTHWAGSYIPIRYANYDDLRQRPIRDGWGRKMLSHYSGYDLLLYSVGPNGIDEAGVGDDRGRWLNADSILWRITKREIRGLNAMIGRYKELDTQHKLPPNFPGTYDKLRNDGLLPSTRPAWKRDYWEDGWGNKYEAETDQQTIERVYSNGR